MMCLWVICHCLCGATMTNIRSTRKVSNLFDFLPDDLVHRVFQSFFAETLNPGNVHNIEPAIALSLTCSRLWGLFKVHISKLTHIHLTETAAISVSTTTRNHDAIDQHQLSSTATQAQPTHVGTTFFNPRYLLYLLRSGVPQQLTSLCLPFLSPRLLNRICTTAIDGSGTKLQSSLTDVNVHGMPHTIFNRLTMSAHCVATLRSLTVTPRNANDLETLKHYLHRHGTSLATLTVRTGPMDEADSTLHGEPSDADVSYVQDHSAAGTVSQILMEVLPILRQMQQLTVDSRGAVLFERLAMIDHAFPLTEEAQSQKPCVVLLGDDDYWFAWHQLCLSAFSHGFNILHRGMGCTYFIPKGSCFPTSISRYDRELIPDVVLLVSDVENATEDMIQFVPMHCRHTYNKCQVLDITTSSFSSASGQQQTTTSPVVTFLRQVITAAVPSLHSLIIREEHEATLQLFRYACQVADIRAVHFNLHVFLYYMRNLQLIPTRLKGISLWFSDDSYKDIGILFNTLRDVFQDNVETTTSMVLTSVRKIELFGFHKVNGCLHPSASGIATTQQHRQAVRELWNTVNEFDVRYPEIDVERVLAVVGHWKAMVGQ